MIYSYFHLTIWLHHCQFIISTNRGFIIFFPSFRAYGTWCDDVNVDSKLESEEKTISAEYTLKLVNVNFAVLDPVSLADSWLKERYDKNGDSML